MKKIFFIMLCILVWLGYPVIGRAASDKDENEPHEEARDASREVSHEASHEESHEASHAASHEAPREEAPKPAQHASTQTPRETPAKEEARLDKVKINQVAPPPTILPTATSPKAQQTQETGPHESNAAPGDIQRHIYGRAGR